MFLTETSFFTSSHFFAFFIPPTFFFVFFFAAVGFWGFQGDEGGCAWPLLTFQDLAPPFGAHCLLSIPLHAPPCFWTIGFRVLFLMLLFSGAFTPCALQFGEFRFHQGACPTATNSSPPHGTASCTPRGPTRSGACIRLGPERSARTQSLSSQFTVSKIQL